MQHVDNKMERMTVIRPLGSIPNRCFGSNESNVVTRSSAKRANRYLQHQTARLQKLMENGNAEGAVIVWCLLAKNSQSYQMALYNKVRKEWYWKLTRGEAWKEWLRVTNHMRSWNLRTYIDRYYIQKKNGSWRPIGAPRLESKVFSRFLSDMVTQLLEFERSKVEISNHAYRPGRGAHTAVRELLSNIERAKSEEASEGKAFFIYEFDLKSFFNNVNWETIMLCLDRYIGYRAGNLVMKYLSEVRYFFREEYREEEELVKFGTAKNGKDIFVRKGIPQGLPVSPVLATVTTEMSYPPSGLTMYADDGIYVGRDEHKLREWFEDGIFSGRKLQKEKSKYCTTGVIEFIGFTIDLNKREITNWQGETVSLLMEEKELDAWLRRGSKYQPQEKKRWEWEVKWGSYAMEHKVSLLPYHPIIWLKTTFYGIFKLEYKGYKWIPFKGIYSYATTSSECINDLLELAKKTKNRNEMKRKKPLRIVDWDDKIVEKPKSRKGYYEFSPHRRSKDTKHFFPESPPSEFLFWMTGRDDPKLHDGISLDPSIFNNAKFNEFL